MIHTLGSCQSSQVELRVKINRLKDTLCCSIALVSGDGTPKNPPFVMLTQIERKETRSGIIIFKIDMAMKKTEQKVGVGTRGLVLSLIIGS